MRPARRTHALLVAATLVPAALAIDVAPASAAKKTKKKLPVVSFVSPMTASVGDTLTIRGHNFRAGRGKNTVVLKRDKGKAVFVRAGVATSKRLTVKLPASLVSQRPRIGGAPQPSRFRVRVLARSFGQRYADLGQSPVIVPVGWRPPVTTPTPGTATATPTPVATPTQPSGRTCAGADDDRLPTEEEQRVGLDPCDSDTDGDGITDDFEYLSAADLNDPMYRGVTAVVYDPQLLPSPNKRPFPNPLDGTDANLDHDGDGLRLAEEYALWRRGGASVESLPAASPRTPKLRVAAYSAGKQKTQQVNRTERPPLPNATDEQLDFNADDVVTDAERYYTDSDQDGFLGDDELDVDQDGLSNFDETHGFAFRPFWDLAPGYGDGLDSNGEGSYVLQYTALDVVDGDTDGDDVIDGLDDSDFDDVPNYLESRRWLSSGGSAPRLGGRMHPFNPCLPRDSRSCPKFVFAGDPFYGRFDDGRNSSYMVLNEFVFGGLPGPPF